MTEETIREEQTEQPESARLFTSTDVAERLRAAKAEWEAEQAQSLERARAAAFADGETAAAAAHSLEIRTLEEKLQAAQIASARRETEIRCAKYLRERSLSETLTEVILSPDETELAEEVLERRIAALSDAVEAAAMRALREKTEKILPGAPSGSVPLTGRIIRETPVAQLSQMLK